MTRLVWLLVLAVAGLDGEEEKAACERQSSGELPYRLAQFVVWQNPAVAGPFTVGLAGWEGEEGLEREWLEARRVQGRVLRLRHVTTTEEMTRCQMVLLGQVQKGRIRQILPQLENAGVLTVSSIGGFGAMGGMVELTASRQRPIVVNMEAARRAGLSFRSSLLAVVDTVRGVSGE